MHKHGYLSDLRYTFNETICFLFPDCPTTSTTTCPGCISGQKFCDVPYCVFIECETSKEDEHSIQDSPGN